MHNGTNNSTAVDSHPGTTNRSSWAWFLPTFVGVFMVIFLLVSWISHHRRFREKYRYRELLEYYLELRVEGGRRRVAAPSPSSSIRTKDAELESFQIFPTSISLVARSSLDPIIGTTMNENDTPVNMMKKKKDGTRYKLSHTNSAFFSFFFGSSQNRRNKNEISQIRRRSICTTSLSPGLPHVSPKTSPAPKFKDETKRAQSDSVLLRKTQNKEKRKCGVDNTVMLLKANSLQPLDDIRGDCRLEMARTDQSLL